MLCTARFARLALRGEFAISGLIARTLQALMPDKTSGQVSRLLKRLRVYGLLKKIGLRYKNTISRTSVAKC